MKKVVALICCAVFLILAASASFAAEKTWKLAHIRPEGTAIDIALKDFASQVKEKTAGRVAIEIDPASQLGDYTTVQERVSIGDVEMQCGPLSPAVVRARGLDRKSTRLNSSHV